jgi:hypothetical protein
MDYARIFRDSNPYNGVAWYDARRVRGPEGTTGAPMRLMAESVDAALDMLREAGWSDERILVGDVEQILTERRAERHADFRVRAGRAARQLGLYQPLDDMNDAQWARVRTAMKETA